MLLGGRQEAQVPNHWVRFDSGGKGEAIPVSKLSEEVDKKATHSAQHEKGRQMIHGGWRTKPQEHILIYYMTSWSRCAQLHIREQKHAIVRQNELDWAALFLDFAFNR